ncbi:GmrSD restriction endonuclease domain-containing protein [Dapis sp. BLCC M229]|uniref:GmrSD restriction endonuclease domain-containing protein n=1 Tax=Dapis sp. BLCC M229 TaxID=3400188 RepID=UPI003CF9289D
MSNLFLQPEDFERIFKDHLKIETYSKSIESLFSDRLLRRIDYKPYYQRNYVWDDDKASYFIESILLGTEIPPLIFFKNADQIEVIDGRQRFETIKRFKNSEFQLTKKGLSALKQLSKSTYKSFFDNPENAHIIYLFLDAKIRIVEFEIVNEPKLDPILEDKIKKEIFARYNSGITPLTTPEIDNAVYDTDPIYQYFKNRLKQEPDFEQLIYNLFLKPSRNSTKEKDRGKILQFIRRNLVLKMFPIRYYSWGNSRTETLGKLFEYLSDQNPEPEPLCQSFIEKVKIVESFRQIFIELKLNHNRLVFECLLWSLLILENENVDLSRLKRKELVKKISKEISNNFQKYYEEQTIFYKQIQERYTFTAKLFEEEFKKNLKVYYEGSDQKRKELSKLRQTEDEDTVTKLSELQYLRVTKPEPSRNSIDDIARVMERKKFLVRPSYQRSEVINLSKASAIIESILLGINLPPIFIFKRSDGISEVIDGQQRLLTILGYLGKEYVDEENQKCRTKNSNFSLKNLRILKELRNKKFQDLELALQDKILDFQLFVVEIEESLNLEFNPVDLFVRLNNKPYPIKENSFEMWNSWAEREVITKIKDNVSKHREWFYLKLAKDRDRMENEELYTSLVYFEFKKLKEQNIEKILKVYKQNNRINARLASIKDISSVLTKVSEHQEDKKLFMNSITKVEKFISKVKCVLLDEDKDKNQLDAYFKNELDYLYKNRKESRSFRRTKQYFYILWYVLSPLNDEMVRYHRQVIKKELKDLFYRMKNSEDSNYDENQFTKEIEKFQNKYKQDKRKLKLSDSDKERLIKQQGNICPISGDPLFMGDEIEVDHKKPLAIGGLDSIDNLQITHKNANRRKGTKYKND